VTECFGSVRTGFPISAATEQEKKHYRLLFGPDSIDPVSHVIEAVDHGFLLQAFNLGQSDVLEVEMVAGADSASYAQPVMINGQPVRVTADNNLVFLPWPLRYQLRKVQGSTPLGGFMVYAVPVPFEFMIGMGAGNAV